MALGSPGRVRRVSGEVRSAGSSKVARCLCGHRGSFDASRSASGQTARLAIITDLAVVHTETLSFHPVCVRDLFLDGRTADPGRLRGSRRRLRLITTWFAFIPQRTWRRLWKTAAVLTRSEPPCGLAQIACGMSTCFQAGEHVVPAIHIGQELGGRAPRAAWRLPALG